MRVLGIAGSPRIEGNTDLLLEEVLRGAESKGATTRLLHVCNLDIAPCIHCDSCLRSGECYFHDDFQKVLKEMEKADRVVLAAPLHFMGIPAQTKALIDRMQSLWVRKYILKIPPLGDDRVRKGLFVSAGGRHKENLFEPVLATVKAFFASLDIKYEGMVAFSGIDAKGEILNYPEALKEAFAAGEKLVQSAE